MRFSSLPRRARAAALMLLCLLFAGCKKKPSAEPSQATQAAPNTPASAPVTSSTSATASASPGVDNTPGWIANPEITPSTVVMTALDPKTMTPSEIQFGVAPKRSPNVDYAPDAIIMEQGDKAIKSVASNGLVWTFDANAPQVSDFKVGKIVFATGRAVGRVVALNQNGSTVTVVLGPIQLTDVVTRGRFVINTPVDEDKLIAYVASDYPGLNDSTTPIMTSSLDRADDGRGSTVLVSTRSNGAWAPTAMSAASSRPRGSMTEARRSRGRERPARFANATVPQLPGMPQGLPSAPQITHYDPGPSKAAGAIPQVLADASNVKLLPVTNNSNVGLQYYFDPKGGTLSAFAEGFISLQKPVIRCVLVISGAKWDSAGISIVGGAGLKLQMDAHSATDKIINFHLKHYVPIDFSIPLGGPVPVSLTFGTFFNINSAFSAKASLLSSEGDYKFSGTMWAGLIDGHWTFDAPTNFTTVKTLGGTAASLSVGINSADLAFGIRSMVGIGGFGFNTGVFATTRFGGAITVAPNEAFACRRGTLSAYMDTGLGWQIPGWAEVAINFFLQPIAGTTVDMSKPLWPGPSKLMHSEDISYPDGCAGKSS